LHFNPTPVKPFDLRRKTIHMFDWKKKYQRY
jgi:hypothetical protein